MKPKKIPSSWTSSNPPTLTAKQSRFIDEYLVDLNGTQAAIRAGYSKKSAKIIAAENLTKPYIRSEVDKRAAEICKKSHEKVSYIVNNLMELSRITDPDKFQHRTKAVELLGKYFALWNDKIDITTNGERLNNDVNITYEVVDKNAST
jgi:phage terminase small subunit